MSGRAWAWSLSLSGALTDLIVSARKKERKGCNFLCRDINRRGATNTLCPPPVPIPQSKSVKRKCAFENPNGEARNKINFILTLKMAKADTIHAYDNYDFTYPTTAIYPPLLFNPYFVCWRGVGWDQEECSRGCDGSLSEQYDFKGWVAVIFLSVLSSLHQMSWLVFTLQFRKSS